jgi:hypothetical protein
MFIINTYVDLILCNVFYCWFVMILCKRFILEKMKFLIWVFCSLLFLLVRKLLILFMGDLLLMVFLFENKLVV